MRTNRLNQVLLVFFLVLGFVWLVLPLTLAALWSLVDPHYAWSYPDLFPQVLSFRRIEFRGRGILQTLVLLPMVLPGFVIAIFFSSLLFSLGIYDKFLGILIGHSVFLLPYAIRILTVSFSQLRQDLIDAARDLGATRLTLFREVYFPAIKPGILASLILVFIYSIEEFALSFIIGSPDFITVPTILFSYLGYQFIRPNAAVVSLILVIPNVVLMLVLEKFLKTAKPATIVGKG